MAINSAKRNRFSRALKQSRRERKSPENLPQSPEFIAAQEQKSSHLQVCLFEGFQGCATWFIGSQPQEGKRFRQGARQPAVQVLVEQNSTATQHLHCDVTKWSQQSEES
jgi:hypothetical protein